MRTKLTLKSALLFGSMLATTVHAEPIEPEMIELPAGSFNMGSDIWHSNLSSAPAHNVTIEKYALAKYEVTNREFRQFIEETDYELENENCSNLSLNNGRLDASPMEYNWYEEDDFEATACVTLNDANAYITWLAEETDKPYRMVTEAEWEYAARAGVYSTRYYFSDDYEDACEHENVAEFTGGLEDINCAESPASKKIVGLYSANPWGFYDMIGNVFEYTADCFHIGYEDAPTTNEAWITDCENDDLVMIRSGSFVFIEEATTGRSVSLKSGSDNMVGFRIAMDLTDGENCLKESDTCTVNDTTKAFREELFDVQLLNVTPEERALREAQKLAEEEAARIAAEEEAARIAAEEEAARIAAEEEAARIAAEEEAASSSSGGALEWFGVLFLSIFLYLRRNKIELTKVW